MCQYSPTSISPLRQPRARRWTISSMSERSVGVTATSRSSKRANPQPPRLIGVQGMTCFCPVSVIAANHGPAGGSRSQARMRALSALLPYQ